MGQYDVFFSYNRQDVTAVEPIARLLQEWGLSVFLDRWYLRPGQPWPQALEAALEGCHACTVFIGPDGLGRWQQRERGLALERQVAEPAFPVIPVLLPGADPALGLLQQNTWIDLRDGIEQPEQLALLARAVKGEPPGAELQGRLAANLASICPYRGLRPFREEDAPFFFGRESFVTRLAELAQARPLVAVVGASGSGKSSVVRAGLVPLLRQGEPSRVWDVVSLLPGDQPLLALAAALLPLLEPEMTEVDRLAEARKLAKHFETGQVSLRDVALRVLEKQPGTNRLLLMVDQWEELYSLTRDAPARQRFIDQICEASSGPLSVVMTLRGDFFGQALSYRSLSDRLQDSVLTLGPMTREELERSVTRPSEKVGLSFEPGLVARILEDVGQNPGTLPLLEFLLTGLWERRRSGRMLHEAYTAMGALQGATASRAEELVQQLTPAEQEATRDLFVHQLVRPGEGTEDTRRRARWAEVSQTAQGVARRLVDARLLITSRDDTTGEVVLEVAHEALIRHWERLQRWLNDDREFLLWHHRLIDRLAEWERQHRSADALLHGTALVEAERWASVRAHSLTHAEQDFIQRGTAHREKDRAAREQLRRRMMTSLMVGFLVALVLAAVAVVQWQSSARMREIAEARGRTALARQLAAQSRTLADQPGYLLQRAALLAVEAMRQEPGVEANQALRYTLKHLLRPVSRVHHPGAHWVDRVAFSPDGKFLASASRAGNGGHVLVRISEAQTGREVNDYVLDHPSLRGTVDTVGVYFSPDGRYLSITCGTRIWLAEWQTRHSPRSLEQAQIFLSFDSTGTRFVARVPSVIGNPSVTSVFETATGKKIIDVYEEGYGAKLSPQQLLLAVGHWAGHVSLWDLNAPVGSNPFTLRGCFSTRDLEFSLNGTYLAATCGKESVVVWRVADRQLVSEVTHGAEVTRIAFNRDGSLLATMSNDGTARIWDTLTGRAIIQQTLQEHAEFLAFAGSPERVVTVTSGDDVRLWDARTGTLFARAITDGDVRQVVVSPDGRYLATAESHGLARVWEVQTAEPLTRMTHVQEIQNLVASERGDLVVSRTGDTVTLWSRKMGQQQILLRQGLGTYPSHVAIAPDGRWVASTDLDNLLIVEDVASRQILTDARFPRNYTMVAQRELECVREVKLEIEADTEERQQFLTDADHVIEMAPIEYISGHESHRPDCSRQQTSLRAKMEFIPRMVHDEHEEPGPRTADIDALALSPDGKLLGVSSLNQVWLLEAPTGRHVARLSHGFEMADVSIPFLHEAARWDIEVAKIDMMRFSPDGRFLATRTSGGVLRIWALDPQPVLIASKVNFGSRDILFTKDGKHLFWTHPRSFDLLSLPELTVTRSVPISGETLDDLRLSRSRKRLAVVSHSRGTSGVAGEGFVSTRYMVEILDTSTWTQVTRFDGNPLIHSVDISPDDRYLLTGDQAGAARVWDMERHTEYSNVFHPLPVKQVLFADDGRLLVTMTGLMGPWQTSASSGEARISLWRHEDLLEEVLSRLTRGLTDAERADYVGSQP